MNAATRHFIRKAIVGVIELTLGRSFLSVYQATQEMSTNTFIKCFEECGIKKKATTKKGLKINYEAIVERDVSWRLLSFPRKPAFQFLAGSYFPCLLRKPS